MDRGFFHPNHGYWQTAGTVSKDIRKAYPRGTVEVPLKPGENFDLKNGAWVERVPTLAEAKAAKMLELADRRWQAETGGVTVAGIKLHTDDRSKLMLAGARIKAQADSTFRTSWAAADGSIVPLTADKVIEISDAVLAHVDACFANFAALATCINAAPTNTALAAIDIEANWPG